MSDHDPIRAYPIPGPADYDPGLALDVADVLQRHGYPVLDSRDMADLQQALRRFLHGPQAGETDA